MGFMHAFSNYYQDLHPVMLPTFEKFLNPSPTLEGQFIYDTFAQVAHLGMDYSPTKFYEMYNEMQSSTSRVDIKLTLAELIAIRGTAIKSAGELSCGIFGHGAE
jgi:hypothetical protein